MSRGKTIRAVESSGARSWVLGLMLLLLAPGLGCARAASRGSAASATAPPTMAPMAGGLTPIPTRWQPVRSWLYQLQQLDVERTAASGFDLMVMDYSADGTDDRRYTPEQVARLKTGPRGPRLVLCYMSIGEAEDYRYYWQRDWRPGNPPWLLPVNPQWPGNYPVQYWEPAWKRVIFGGPDAYLDRIIDAGFDGVYLDIVDGYEHFQAQRPTARQEMVDFVREIATYARTVRGRSDFGVFPQNAEPLVDVPGFLDAVTGVGREELYYGNPDANRASPRDFTRNAERLLDQFRAAGKLVLIVDYTQRPEQVANVYGRARQRGYVPYATVRELDRMVVNRGYDPD